jgi:hypothetical protein
MHLPNAWTHLGSDMWSVQIKDDRRDSWSATAPAARVLKARARLTAEFPELPELAARLGRRRAAVLAELSEQHSRPLVGQRCPFVGVQG